MRTQEPVVYRISKSPQYGTVSLMNAPLRSMDIIYITDSVLVVTPTGNQTAMVIVRTNENFPCLDDALKAFPFFVPTTIKLVLSIVSDRIIVMYLDMRTSFGLLMVLYNGAIIFQCLSAIALLFTNLYLRTDSQLTCYAIHFVFMQGLMVPEAFATIILAHISYIMYYSNKLLAELPVMKMFKHYTIFVASILGLFSFFIIMYDMATGNSRNAIIRGYCIPLNKIYTTTDIARVCVALNKAIQVMLFATFLVSLCQHKKTGTTEVVAVNKLLNKLLIRVGIIMGAVIGISQFFWLLVIIFHLYYLNAIAANFLLVIQQCVILAVSYKKMVKLCAAKK